MIPQFPNFSCAVAGLKGLEFLQNLETAGIFPSIVISYDQADDLSRSFEKIKDFCEKNSINFQSTKRPSFTDSEIIFVVGWQFLIENCPKRLIVFHDSLLPAYRGFAPTASALICGEKKIGTTALLPVEEVDAGPIVAQKFFDVSYPMRIEEALNKQAMLMSDLAIQILGDLANGTFEAKEQNTSLATYSIWRNDQDFLINWDFSSEEILRTIYACGYPYACANTTLNGKTIKLLDAETVEDIPFKIRQPGKIWQIQKHHAVVVCGKGLLKITHAKSIEGDDIQFNRLRVRLGS